MSGKLVMAGTVTDGFGCECDGFREEMGLLLASFQMEAEMLCVLGPIFFK